MANDYKRPKVAAYCRVSTDKEDQLMSLQTQKEFFTEYAQMNNFELVALYADEGISGTKLKNRREFNRMMRDAEQGRFDRVYVKDVSRLARNVVDFLQSIRKLKALNIDCQFITANMSTNDGELTLTILAAVAQEESANLSKRVKFGKKQNAEKGKVPNLVYGYDKIIGDYFNLAINQAEARVITRIFDMYLNQGLGMNKIAQILNQEGLTTKRNCRWSQQAISTILTNPIYTGTVINGKEQVVDFLSGKRVRNQEENYLVVEKPQLKIIEQSDFKRVADIINDRHQTYGHGKSRHSSQYPFSTLIKCQYCGYSFRRIHRQYKNAYIRWVCSGRNANGVDFCDNHVSVDENQLLTEIKDYLKNLVIDRDKLLERTIQEVKKRYQPEKYEVDEQSITVKLNQLKKAKSKQTQMYEIDAITLEELKERTTELNQQIGHWENQLTILQKNTAGNQRIDHIIEQYCSQLDDIFTPAILDNHTLKQLIDQIVVSLGGQITVYIKDLNKVND